MDGPALTITLDFEAGQLDLASLILTCIFLSMADGGILCSLMDAICACIL